MMVTKADVVSSGLGVTAAVRKQVPVLLDFNEGRIYIENHNKKLIYSITTHLNRMGVDTFPVAWTYSHPNWTAEVLGRLYEGGPRRM